MNEIKMPVIGRICSPYKDLENMPVQPVGAGDVSGQLIIDEEYKEGLKDLEGFSHIYIFYHFHETQKTSLTVKPFMDTKRRGVFSTRAPVRPSHLGMSVIEVVSVEDSVVNVKGLDVLNGTPLIDIKPYILKFDYRENARSGWLTASAEEITKKRSDKRFE